MLELLGYVAAVLMGLTLGLIGGGGSILTVPILVYLFGQSATVATGTSLVVVGTTALVGAFSYLRRSEANLRVAFTFGLPSIVAVYLTRAYLMPAIPERVPLGVASPDRDQAILVLFALLMLGTSFSMIRHRPSAKNPPEKEPIRVARSPARKAVLTIGEGALVGMLTGLVGAGGGFLIVPALVLMTGLPMRTAVGTSLLIIAAKSLIGSVGDVQSGLPIDWSLVGAITALAVVGITVGTALSARVPADRLKKAFGVFVLLMGGAIIVTQIAGF